MSYCHVSAQIDEHLAREAEADAAWERLSEQVESEYSYEQLEEIAEAIRWRDKPKDAETLMEMIIENRWQAGR